MRITNCFQRERAVNMSEVYTRINKIKMILRSIHYLCIVKCLKALTLGAADTPLWRQKHSGVWNGSLYVRCELDHVIFRTVHAAIVPCIQNEIFY